MEEPNKTFAPELSPAGSRKWIARLMIAVLLGAAIWTFIVALTGDVILPALAQVMEAEPNSPLYLGKGDFNLARLFAAVLELCLALIAAIGVNAWAQHAPKAARKRPAKMTTAPKLAETRVPTITPASSFPLPLSPEGAPPASTPRPRPDLETGAAYSPGPVLAAPQMTQTRAASAPASPRSAQQVAQPEPAPVVSANPTTKPETAKAEQPKAETPKKPKKVYYNLVGEPIESDEE